MRRLRFVERNRPMSLKVFRIAFKQTQAQTDSLSVAKCSRGRSTFAPTER